MYRINLSSLTGCLIAISLCLSTGLVIADEGEKPEKTAEVVMPKNPICYWELASHNAPESVAFFEKVFEWNFEYDERTTIHEMVAQPEMLQLAGGGIFTLQKAKLPFLTLYIKVENIEEMAKKVEEAGGFIVIEPFDIGGGLWICLFNEPSGTTWAMLERK